MCYIKQVSEDVADQEAAAGAQSTLQAFRVRCGSLQGIVWVMDWWKRGMSYYCSILVFHTEQGMYVPIDVSNRFCFNYVTLYLLNYVPTLSTYILICILVHRIKRNVCPYRSIPTHTTLPMYLPTYLPTYIQTCVYCIMYVYTYTSIQVPSQDSKQFIIENPATRQPITKVAAGGVHDIDHAVTVGMYVER